MTAPVKVMRSRARVRSGTALIWIGAAFTVFVVAVAALTQVWSPLVLLVLGPLWMVRGLLERRTAVALTEDGVELRTPGVLRLSTRTSTISWEDVLGLRTDPPGGPRQIWLRLTSGREVCLPPLTDYDNESVRRAFAAAFPDRERP